MSFITYKSHGETHTVELGNRYKITREYNEELQRLTDVSISRAIAYDCPIFVELLVRSDGTLDVWSVVFLGCEANPYWHFSRVFNREKPGFEPTAAQVGAIKRLQENDGIYGNLGGNVGADVLEWAFGKRVADAARMYHT